MHAASVNPEPGSNSLKNYIFSSSRYSIPFSELFILASFFTFWVSQCVLTRFAQSCAFSNFVLFNFQWSSADSESAWLLYNKASQLSIVFLKFFRIFSFFNKKIHYFHQKPLLFYAHLIIHTHIIYYKRKIWRAKKPFLKTRKKHIDKPTTVVLYFITQK